jgi:hypothetical protein
LMPGAILVTMPVFHGFSSCVRHVGKLAGSLDRSVPIFVAGELLIRVGPS